MASGFVHPGRQPLSAQSDKITERSYDNRYNMALQPAVTNVAGGRRLKRKSQLPAGS